MSSLTSAWAIERAQTVVAREAQAVQALAGQIDGTLVDVLQALLLCEGHVLVTGAGTSAAVAARFAHLLCCCGTPALFINAADALHGGAGAIRRGDVVFIISKGGQSAEISQFAALARERGARVVVQTEAPGAPLAKAADVVYIVKATGDVDPFGMIATGSSLVNAAAGDVICTLLLELRGYSRVDFGRTHPAGAVGKTLADEKS